MNNNIVNMQDGMIGSFNPFPTEEFGITELPVRIKQKNGSVLLYYAFPDVDRMDKYYANSAGCHAVTFSDVPCDEDGNILLISHWISSYKKEEGGCYQQYWQLNVLCSKEPTHRLNLRTGDISPVKGPNSDGSINSYLNEIIYSYILGKWS